jgi:hypothetical protein
MSHDATESLVHAASEASSHLGPTSWRRRIILIVLTPLAAFLVIKGLDVVWNWASEGEGAFPSEIRGHVWTGEGTLSIGDRGDAVVVVNDEAFRLVRIRNSGQVFDADLKCNTHGGKVGSASIRMTSNATLTIYMLFVDGRSPTTHVLVLRAIP